MDYRVCKFKLAIFSLFLVMNPKIECLPRRQTPGPPLAPIRPTPLCDAQIAVASSACSMMPFSTIPPPTPLSLDSPSPSPESPPPSHRHRHRHRHPGHRQTPVEHECCHWVRAIDSVCVCNLLVYLPVFLSKPAHRYTVITDPSCNVAYTCPGRLIG
ncbi:hypothetical protein DCAR_0102880 [Daucus carota subsp. sativus]|uniref:Uncharacterized protein n=1 Tax=Daucus carota subsp. sativus TaxID=79200 RepID=A0A166HCQ0_DAUCS|nr:hypothetical protein DCAR_0102880 [Daucus carota subsp. sativus]